MQDAETVQVAKAVRIASGLRAAMALADLGHTVECAALLRMVADFSSEILFIGEGLIEGRFTDEQTKYIAQHFSPMPSDPDELAAREREYYVGRKAIASAHARLLEKTGAPKEQHAKYSAYLNKGFDMYVHGHYRTAMELYTGESMSFMMRGNKSARLICVAKVTVAGKLKEALNSLRFMSMTRQMQEVNIALVEAFDKIDKSGEDTSLPCRGL